MSRGPESEILVGGQAVLEGVMMKTPRSWAVTVRRPDGSLASSSGVVAPWAERWPVLKLPVLRGGAVLGQMLVLGMRALFFSSDIAAAEEKKKADGASSTSLSTLLTAASLAVLSAVADGPDGDEVADTSGAPDPRAKPAATADPPRASGLSSVELGLTLAMALGMFVVVFKLMPLGVAWLGGQLVPQLQTHLAQSVVSGIALAAIFVGYLLLISRMRDIRRVFQYHGAEHQVVHVHEKGEPLTVENAGRQSTIHPRCGTSFLFFVVLTSIVVWSLFPIATSFLGKFALRLALFPLILGLAYELIRLSARHRDNPFFKALMAPGLWSQRITTKPPDDSMREVSLHSLALASAVSPAPAGAVPLPLAGTTRG